MTPVAPIRASVVDERSIATTTWVLYFQALANYINGLEARIAALEAKK